MKVVKLAILLLLNLLNNIKTFVTTFIERKFKSILQKTKMDQDEEQQNQEPEAYNPFQMVNFEEIDVDDEDLDMDIEHHDVDENDDEYETDNTDDDEESMEDDVDEVSDDYYTQELIEEIVDMRQMYRQQYSDKKPKYSFKPLRLVRCHYKHRNLSCYPIARSGHRIIASESHLYSLGGYNPNRPTNRMRRDACMLFQELWAYNFATSRWKLLLHSDNSDMPTELASNALVIYNNVLISHGGTGYPFGEICSNDCYVYTTGENPQVMRLKITGDLPTAQYGPCIVTHNDYLYTIGGTTGFDYSCDVYRLNLITKVWENVYICRPEMRDDPEGRYRHEVVYDGKHIFILGGGTSHTVYDLQRIPAFNLETNRWEYFDTLPDRTTMSDGETGYPKARKCLSCVQHTQSNGDIEAFISGGLQGDYTTYFDDIWKLNLRTKQWFKIQSASLKCPLYFHSAAQDGNGCMYIFGGIEYNNKEMHRRNHLYKMWMTIPKLSEICWDAITFYNRNLDCFDRNTLLQSGIPDRYLNRLPLQRRMRKPTSEHSSSVFIDKFAKIMHPLLQK